jgi:hypothetical protein
MDTISNLTIHARDKNMTSNPMIVLNNLFPEIDIPADRHDWEPDDYARYSAAIIVLASHLIRQFGPLMGIHAAFERCRSDELRGECCLRFGLFPPEPNSVTINFPASMAELLGSLGGDLKPEAAAQQATVSEA